MSDDARTQRLRAVPLLSEISDAAMERVVGTGAEIEVEPGHVLMERGHPGAGLFVIEEGTVEIDLSSRTVELGPGEFFGELALLNEAAHTGRARAKTRVTAFAISRNDFTQLIESEPKLALSMLYVLAKRLGEAP